MAIRLIDAGPSTIVAEPSDLPYALVTPGEWTLHSDSYDVSTLDLPTWKSGGYWWIENESLTAQGPNANNPNALSLEFLDGLVTATRPSLPGQLVDRANNLIDATTGNVTLTLPQFMPGKVRDLLVACTIGVDGNDEPWSLIFQGDDGEEISFKAEGDDASTATFPVPDAAGDWWYSLTERAPHVFAVSLKQLQSVSQSTQTQGGV